MADFIEVCKKNELTNGTMKRVYMEGKDITLALVEGKYYAAAGRCPHMKAFLSRGTLKGTIVTCPMHGSQFDLQDGKVVRWVTVQALNPLSVSCCPCWGWHRKRRNHSPSTRLKLKASVLWLKSSEFFRMKHRVPFISIIPLRR